MFNVPILSSITITISLLYLLISTPPKSYYHSLFLSDSLLSNNTSIENHLFTLTKRPHIAGSQANAEAAQYVVSTLTCYNIPSHVRSYDVLLSYPLSRTLVLTPPLPYSPIVFNLKQEVYKDDPYANVADQVTDTFHAYAKSGDITGQVVYVNYGSIEDYEVLEQMGVNVTGAIALARYGRIYRGDIVENAYHARAVGILVFTDRIDYGGGGGHAKWFPEEKWMPPCGVQVGTVFNGAGDPTTPGWPSTGGCERLSDDEVEKGGDVPLIPSLPISWADGYEIMKFIGGEVANDDWQGGKDAPVYRIGPGPGIINLNYKGEQVIRTIENVIGVIEGAEEPDRYVILGNHRDAWTFGAVDPNSGTAALLEVARRLDELQMKGWKPRRTIIICNWDAEEYGLVGSTEWVEENRELLSSRVVAYLNVDCAVKGAGFQPFATPQLDELLIGSAKQVQDPDNASQTIYQSWIANDKNPAIGRLGGAGSDYAAFVQHIGIPGADVSFGQGYPVYHSMYDDFIWMKKFGDPLFRRHAAVASLWGLMALQLADNEILPFNYLSYAYELQKCAGDLKDELINNEVIILTPLFESIEKFKKAASKVDQEKKEMEASKSNSMSWKVREINDRLMMTERAFTDGEGLPGRPWSKHLIYAPSKHDDYGSNAFPGINDAIENAKIINSTETWQSVQHEVWRVSRAITHASLVLNGALT
ncbi:metalloprotease [Lithospermum erythrorhizon]|uniref:glutamate carboxypeptidase II n=1 Tax=Lithospermum erythrorhizon TaxID=34254 RepID=A0AAV3RYS4_LITER